MDVARLYNCYNHMINRCYNVDDIKYKDYGGRGIMVGKEWHSFDNFKNWAINNGYADNLTIERIDVNLGYYPENCKWIPKNIQACNKRNNRKLTAFNETKNIMDWLKDERCKVGYNCLNNRLKKGWPEEAAISAPYSKAKYTLTAFGETKTLTEWVRDNRCVVGITTLQNRCYKHNDFTPEEMLTKPSQKTRL